MTTRSVSTVQPIGKPEAMTTQSIGSLKSYNHGNKQRWRHPYTTSFYSIGNGEPPPTDDHHPTRLPGFAW
uniref:Uncharacterized protein n=1 Tax=Oryza rufipogon TaxID=4529 RepID=A0A0E0R864_ORYRU